jgi:hypothetical protein
MIVQSGGFVQPDCGFPGAEMAAERNEALDGVRNSASSAI